MEYRIFGKNKKSFYAPTNNSKTNKLDNLENTLRELGVTPPPPKKKRGALDRVFDALSVGQYVSANIAKDLTNKDGNTHILKDITEGLKAANPFGADYKDGEGSYSDVLENAGVKNKFVKGVGGFIGDVFLDPTTYLGGAGVAKALAKGSKSTGKSALKFAGKTLLDDSTLRKIGDNTLAPLVDKLGKTKTADVVLSNLKYGYKVPQEVLDTVGKVKNKGRMAKEDIFNYLDNLFKGTDDNKFKSLTLFLDNPNRKFSADEMMEIESTLSKLKGNFSDMVRNDLLPESVAEYLHSSSNKDIYADNPIKALTDFILDNEKSRGILKEGKENYIPHIYENWEEALAQTKIPTEKMRKLLASTKDKYSNQRIFDTLDEAMEYGLKPNFNTPELLYKRASTASNKITNHDIASSIKELRVGKPTMISNKEALSKLVDTDYQLVDGKKIWDTITPDRIWDTVVEETAPYGWRETVFEGLKGTAFPPEVANYLDNLHKVMNTDEGMTKLKKVWMQANNLWKSYAVFSPRFHVRNAMDNIFKGYLADVKMSSYKKTLDAFKFNKPLDIVVDGARYSNDDILRKAKELGAIGTGRYTADMAEHIGKKELGKSRSLKPWDTNNKYLSFSRDVIGENLENASKLSMFVDRLEKGKSFEEAAQDVKKFLFNYDEITPFVREMKNYVPFITFTSKNIPLIAGQLLENPQKFANIKKAKEGIETSLGADKNENKFDYLDEMFALNTGMKDKKENSLYFNPGLSFQDINKFNIKDAPRELVGMTTPLMKLPLELLFNKSMFFDSPIERYEGQTSPLPFRPDNSKMRVPIKMRYAMDNLIPNMKTFDTAYRAGDKDEKLNQLMGLLGLKLYKNDKEKLEKAEYYGRKKQLDDLIRKLRDEGRNS